MVTLADLNTALAGLTPLGGSASVDPNTGNITVTSSTTTDNILVGGTVTARNFGIRITTALPSNNTVVGQDVTSFLAETVAGGSVTALRYCRARR